MVIQPSDRKPAATAQRGETPQAAEARAQESAKAQKVEAPAAAPRAGETDSFSTLRLRRGAGVASKGVDLAAHAASIKERRRSTRSAADSGGQLIGVMAAAPARTTVLDPGSAEGQKAVKTTVDFINSRANSQGFAAALSPFPDASQGFQTHSIERDELGMTHVRMDRRHEGLRVFGEQVVSHMDKAGAVSDLTGQLSVIPAGLGTAPVKVSKDQALQIAAKDFVGSPDRAPTAERVIVKASDGQYHSAWRVEMTNLSNLRADDRPRRMNYLIDTETGKTLEKFNQIGGIEVRGPQRVTALPAAATDSVSKTATPNAAIRDNSTTTSTIDVAEGFDVDKFKLDLDIAHTYKGDLRVTLTSPSGKSAVVHDRAGGATDDVKAAFDLSTAFAGEKVQGQWKLTVEDKAARDVGTLKSWGFTATAKTGNPPPPPVGQIDDASLYSGKVQLDTTKNANGTYRLEDASRGQGVATYDAKGSQRPTNPVAVNDNNNIWGEAADPAANRAAVDAQYGTQMTYDFFRDVLGRDSIDAKGEKLTSYVHVGNNYVNAFWDGEKMNYGDGDGRQAGPLTTLDIAGHEITHGLTERTAGLVYNGESGGLNEAFSDIMGTGLEWYASQKNKAVKFDWTVGEDAWTPTNGDNTDGLRYMDAPKKDDYSIDHYGDYPRQTEVHGSSGIANNAFFLLANGGTNTTSGQTVADGIGMEKGLKVFYRALAYYMTPRTNFAGAREATIKAATDLYGATSPEVQRVKDSWGAVGVA